MGDLSNGRDIESDVAMTALSADRSCTDPKDDLFGHAPFARIWPRASAVTEAAMVW